LDTYYSVTLLGKTCGKAEVRRQGLYYRISCRCSLETADLYRLMVSCGGKEESLGILAPEGGTFQLNTKLPVKRIGEGELQFRLVTRRNNAKTVFVPIYPEEPFTYLSRLKESFLSQKDGQLGIQI